MSKRDLLIKYIELTQLQVQRNIKKHCGEKFYEFCRHMDEEFFNETKWHIKLVCKYLQKLADREIKQLAISMPPRSGKSYTVSLFHAWLIGKYPKMASMRNSYAAELADKFSRNIRDIVESEKYKMVFSDIEIRQDKRSIADWSIKQARDSTYFCAGVGGAITGKGCNMVATLDDPIKNIEEALSPLILDNIWNWYTSTHLSRCESGCAELQVATRWSKKDPIGRILEDKTEVEIEPYVKRYDSWTSITIPALINGETFCEDVKTTEEYLEIKNITDSAIWEAEYMQNPVDIKGLLYPAEELRRFKLSDIANKTPDGIIGYTDVADQGSDFLCSIIGKKFGDHTYITNVVFSQEGVEITEPLTAEMIIEAKCKLMTVESNAGGKSFGDNVRKILRDISSDLKKKHRDGYASYDSIQKAAEIDGYTIYPIANTQNKETRIILNAGYVKQYFVFRDDYSPGSDYDLFMRHLTSYVKMGKNRYDDAPDCVTGLAIYLQNNFFLDHERLGIDMKNWYTDDELDDMYQDGIITKYDINIYKKTGGIQQMIGGVRNVYK